METLFDHGSARRYHHKALRQRFSCFPFFRLPFQGVTKAVFLCPPFFPPPLSRGNQGGFFVPTDIEQIG